MLLRNLDADIMETSELLRKPVGLLGGGGLLPTGPEAGFSEILGHTGSVLSNKQMYGGKSLEIFNWDEGF